MGVIDQVDEEVIDPDFPMRVKKKLTSSMTR